MLSIRIQWSLSFVSKLANIRNEPSRFVVVGGLKATSQQFLLNSTWKIMWKFGSRTFLQKKKEKPPGRIQE